MRMQDTINHSLESGKPAKKRNHISFSDFLITKKKSRVLNLNSNHGRIVQVQQSNHTG
ncbi:unnamed protein product [Brassica napus]|uniref:(rape) hypothetical protein n=1 Tax=Brassica napus TaxID=3708 RepID=A0A816KU81_BRANA|nr:unnamed protein product [Brassica napus]